MSYLSSTFFFFLHLIGREKGRGRERGREEGGQGERGREEGGKGWERGEGGRGRERGVRSSPAPPPCSQCLASHLPSSYIFFF